MKKVTIVITDEGWTTTIELGSETIIDKHKATSYGAAGVTGCLEDNLNLSDDLCDAVESAGTYDIMKALRNE